jgi:large subunit ribosomal protein L35
VCARPRLRAFGAPCASCHKAAICFNWAMPKMKTHSGAKKRFHKTAGGKLRGRHAFMTHILRKKSSRRRRRLRRPAEVSRPDRREVKELLAGRGRR